MRFPRTIGFRITVSFGLLILVIVLNAILAYRIIDRTRDTQNELSGVLEPSIRHLMEFQGMLLLH